MSKEKEALDIAFEAFYEQYYMRTFYYIQKKINNPHDAEDLACEVFVYCYKNFLKYDSSRASLATWLYLIVNCRIKNYYRDKKEFVEIEQLDNVLFSEADIPGQAVLLEEQRNVIARAIKTLPERQQEIVILKYFYNNSSAEIAMKMGLTSGNVRVLLSRALNKIENYYKQHMD